MNDHPASSDVAIPAIHGLAEDELYRAIVKPSGVHSVSLTAGDLSVASWLRNHFPEQTSVGGPTDAGLTHRLDQETSGVLIAARSQDAWQHLRGLFSSNRVTKWYVALLEGNLSSSTTCSAAIVTRYRHSKTVITLSREQAAEPHYQRRFHSIQPALSTFFPLAQLTPEGPSLVAMLIKTGRRHQIRAHAASLGHPLAGDTQYGALTHPPALEGRPLLLHSLGVSFVGVDGKRRTYRSLETLPPAITGLVRRSWPSLDIDSAKLFSFSDTAPAE